MAIVYDGFVGPEDLTQFVRNVPEPGNFALSALLPRTTTTTNEVDFGGEVQITTRTAPYRAWDSRIPLTYRDSGTAKRMSLPPLSTGISTGEYEKLRLRFLETGGTRQSALVNAIYDDATRLTREVQARLELACGDVLIDGKMTINENGLVTEADFGLPANHVVTPGTAWTDPAATPLSDLYAWAQVYRDTNGDAPGSILTSTRVTSLLVTNDEFVNAIRGTAAGATRVGLGEINTFLAGEGLPTLLPAYDSRVVNDGQNVRVIPDNRVALLPTDIGSLGEIRFGVTATALEMVQSNQTDFSFEQAPGIVGVVVKEGMPFRETTYVDAVAMPILRDARRLFTATVAAA